MYLRDQSAVIDRRCQRCGDYRDEVIDYHRSLPELQEPQRHVRGPLISVGSLRG